MRLPRSWLLVVVVALLAVETTACTPKAAGPGGAASAFLDALAERDVAQAASRTDQPRKARAVLAMAWDQLQATGLTTRVDREEFAGDSGTVDCTYRWLLPKGRVWTYSAKLRVGRRDGTWSVRWSSADVHPRLGDNQSLVLRTTAPPKARVNEQAGSDVLVPGRLHAVLLDPAVARGPGIGAVAERLAATLARFDGTLTAQAIAESASAAKAKHLVILLHDEDFGQVAPELSVLPGVSFVDRDDLVATNPDFAPALVAKVRGRVDDELDGKAGWSVITVNPNGADTDVLTETPPSPTASVRLTLDRHVQDAAQRAVDTQTKQAMIVVLQPSTGAVLAVAQNKAADATGTPATTGLYPPGSTFKIVTAAAAIDTGRAVPSTPVPCPGNVVIGERTVPNYDGFSLGTVPMSTAFARSCNTTFARLAADMKPGALRDAAAQLGVIQDYTVDGLPTVAASVPAASDLTVRTEDGFGQGRILASPFAMAVAAAAVANGSAAPPPYLITGRPTAVKGARTAVSQPVIAGLREMMREVVVAGTGQAVAGQGEVYGKTGEAEFPGGSHAWFVGYRGDLAFATLIVGGGSSDNAVVVTRDMLAALP